MNQRGDQDPGDSDRSVAETALQWVRARGSAARIVSRARVQRQRRMRARTRAGIFCALLMGAVAVARWPRLPEPAPAAAVRTVIADMPAREVLPDGSIVELRTGTTIAIEFDVAARRIVLGRGQALFSVVKDSARPFTVAAAGVEIRSLGTEFSVQLEHDQVEVLVTEGRVAVEKPARATTPGPAPTSLVSRTARETIATLGARERVVIPIADGDSGRPRHAARPTVVSLPEAEANALLAWRVPGIELTGTLLSEVIEVFNRHGAVRLKLADPALGKIALSGVLRPDNPNALLHVLKVDFGLKADRQPNGEIVLRSP